MSVASINQELVNMQSATAVKRAQDRATNGASQELDGDAFLMLMMEQLKNQDPMSPMDNTEMLAQQAQFTQIQELQKLNSTMNQNTMVQQASSLVGKTVQLIDPNNTSRVINGVVTSANFNGNETSITVNGKEYPLGLVTSITDGAAPSDNSTILSKKLSELNNASGITDGYIYATIQDKNYQKTNKDIKISKDMTVQEFMERLKEVGINSSLNNGILTIEKGNNKAISLTQGKSNDSLNGSNILERMEMFQSETGNLETRVLDFNRK